MQPNCLCSGTWPIFRFRNLLSQKHLRNCRQARLARGDERRSSLATSAQAFIKRRKQREKHAVRGLDAKRTRIAARDSAMANGWADQTVSKPRLIRSRHQESIVAQRSASACEPVFRKPRIRVRGRR